MELYVIGIYNEMCYRGSYCSPWAIDFIKCSESIKDYISSDELSNKNEMMAYLDSGICLAYSCGYSNDILNPEKRIGIVPDILTDGRYLWHRNIIYYVDKYNLRLPKEFLDYAESQQWKVGITEEYIDKQDDLKIMKLIY